MTTAKITHRNGREARRTALYILPETLEAIRSFQEWESAPRASLGFVRRRTPKLTLGQAIDELVPLAIERLEQIKKETASGGKCRCSACSELDERSVTPGAVDQQIEEAIKRG